MGAVIIAHENTRKHLAAATRVDDWDFNFPPAPAAAIPSEVYASDSTLDLNNTNVELKYHGPAHTDGDTTVIFTEAEVIHAGDIYWNGFYPFIDYSTGGSIDGTIQAVESIMGTVSERSIIIPGHGSPASSKAELRSYYDMLTAVREKVAMLKLRGRTLEETIAAGPTREFDAHWGRFVVTPATFTKLVYAGV